MGMQLLVLLALVGLTFSAAAKPECHYGEGRYTHGTVLCQAGLRMQCRSDDEGQAIWASMNQECSVPAIANEPPTAPKRAGEREVSGGKAPASLEEVATAAPAAATPERSDTPSATAAPEAAAVPEPSPRQGPVIEILWAQYGRDGQACDAAPSLRERCGGEAECEIAVEPGNFCGDPFPGHPKLLSVYWKCTDGADVFSQPALYGKDHTRVAMQCS